MDLYPISIPEYNLIIVGKYLSFCLSVCDINFAIALTVKLMQKLNNKNFILC